MELPVSKLPTGFAPIRCVREVLTELTKVTWPTRQETIKLTLVVIAISLIVGVFIGVIDSVFLNITTKFLVR